MMRLSQFQHRERENAFSMLELMIVIVIIGILAAITIPAFANQQQAAHESALKQDIANANKRLQQEALSNSGKWPATIPADFLLSPASHIDIVVENAVLSQDGTYYTPTANAWIYCLEGYTDANLNLKFSMDINQGSLKEGSCLPVPPIEPEDED